MPRISNLVRNFTIYFSVCSYLQHLLEGHKFVVVSENIFWRHEFDMNELQPNFRGIHSIQNRFCFVLFYNFATICCRCCVHQVYLYFLSCGLEDAWSLFVTGIKCLLSSEPRVLKFLVSAVAIVCLNLMTFKSSRQEVHRAMPRLSDVWY